ncbi:protein maelstrom homolog isoform X2 [Pseudomyrmex gracilis]|uniref:protein maelstrom homolog isoform X2 n=1 Tax=Pseudomyrmex gracilis TaxID=219809 RepID=UPI000994C373|nr:protein maelstrom homolog isoform X2 [Pseudomyrmex gracilis]
MPKKGGKNAFYFFMIDWKTRAERQGAVFPNGLRDVQLDPDCSAEWKNLTKQEKGKYEAMAKKDKITSQISVVKRTTLGEDINHLEAKAREQQRFKELMNHNIKSMIKTALSEKNLSLQVFVLIHTNYFFKELVAPEKIKYFPAEYAVSIFSLENGIETTQNVVVSIPIPLGYKREALESSKEIHGIPVEYAGGENNFADIYAKLVDFLAPYINEQDKYPPFYTTNENLLPVRSLLEQLCHAVKRDTEQFVVYELETLYARMAEELYKERDDRNVKLIPAYAMHMFKRCTYMSDIGSECAFHKYSTNPTACSSFELQRWVWIFCEEFCESLRIDLRPGVHHPKKERFDNFATVTRTLDNMKIVDNSMSDLSEPENAAILSSTNVSEQHRIKVSSRSYKDELRRRNQSAPIKIIQYGSDESINKLADKAGCSKSDDTNLDESVKNSVEEPVKSKWVPSYAAEASHS